MDLKDMLGKKSKDTSPEKKEAKLKAIQEMRDMASGLMGEDLKGSFAPKKAVTVAANDEEGLKEGLEKAEEILESDSSMEDSEEEMEKSDEELTLEDIERMEKELQEMKQKLMSAKG